MIRRYLITPHNSTINGNPGRTYDWSKFCWDGSEENGFDLVKGLYDDEITNISYAPLPWVDGRPEECQYLHVPYDWRHDQQIFRIYPNDSMWPSKVYRGLKVKLQRAVQLDGSTRLTINGLWYWELEGEKE